MTQEIIRIPASVDEPFIWRLSLAKIAAAGPFSDFTGYTRALVLLKGEGIKLKFLAKHEHVMSRMGDLFEFEGSVAVNSELIGGPCVDLNLITTHAIGLVNAQVHQLAQPLLIPESFNETLLIFSVSGTVVVEDARGEFEIMESWDTVICPPSDASVTCRSAAHSPSPAMIFTARVALPAP